MRSFETTDAWEILLLRSFFFFLGVSVFLLSMYKKDVFKTIKKAGFAGLFVLVQVFAPTIAHIVGMLL